MHSNEIISYISMCQREGLSLQRGMNFAPSPKHSVVLSSHRPNAPYEDRLEENGTVLIYEGHDEPRSGTIKNPKEFDQPLRSRAGRPTANGLFHEAAQSYFRGEAAASKVRVYEKIKDGIWSYNGVFLLEDSWTETKGDRRVFKFKLRATDEDFEADPDVHSMATIEHRRIIPTSIKLAVWKRDKGACVECGATDHLHFDHILPYSKGGTSDSIENIQILCMRHNLAKGAQII